MLEAEPLLEVRNLTAHFSSRNQFSLSAKSNVVTAVDGVSFSIQRGEVLGLVGESGCGKSTVSRAILRLIAPTSGEVLFEGKNLLDLSDKAMRRMRRRMQMVFQDPYASLNPSMTIYQTISELLKIHGLANRKTWRDRTREALTQVELNPDFIDRYPHEFSGGQRQRISIARALVVNPEFLIADEPVSSLDVSVQAQIINLLQELQEKLGLTYLFISHDLSVVRHISTRIAIMYLGKIVELSDTRGFFDNPLHPYSQALLSAIPIPDPLMEMSRKRIILRGEVPSAFQIPKGCRFHTRCWRRMEICMNDEPALKQVKEGRHVACHLYP
jgi:oligopeptide transport system ATP-binding protein